MSFGTSGSRTRRLGGNVAWLIANRLLRVFTGIAVLGAVGRYLGPEQFGQLNYAIGLVTIFATIANLGFEGIIIRDLVREPHRASAILGTAFFLRLAGGLSALALVVITTYPTGDRAVLALAAIVALSFFPGAFDVVELWYQKNVDARRIFLPRALATLLVAGFRIILVVTHAPLAAFAWSQFLEAALGAAGLLWTFHRSGQRLREWRWQGSLARRILRDSWPLILSGVLIAFYARIEQLLVKAVLGDYVLGVYYAAIRIAETWVFVPTVILATIYPALVAARERQDSAAFQARLQMMFDVLTGLAYALAFGVTLAAAFVLPLIFGPAYRDAVPILIIQAWTAPFLFSGAARAQYFLLENLTIHHTSSAAIGIAVNIGLALWWMKIFGAEGAALAALVAAAMSAYVTSFLFPRLRPAAHLQTSAFLVPFRLLELWRTLRAHL